MECEGPLDLRLPAAIAEGIEASLGFGQSELRSLHVTYSWRVTIQRTNRGVPRTHEQDRRVGPVFGGVGQCGVSLLVECPPLGCLTEELGGAAGRQPGAAGK